MRRLHKNEETSYDLWVKHIQTNTSINGVLEKEEDNEGKNQFNDFPRIFFKGVLNYG